MQIVGLVLAAGAAERMGRAKQVLPVGGSTFVARVVDAALAAGLDEVIVVTGFHAPLVRAALGERPVRLVQNPDPGRGNRSSLLAGIGAAGDADAVVVLLADQPGIDVGAIRALTSVWREDPAWGAVVVYGGRVAHPFLLSREALGALDEIAGPRPLWRLLGEERRGRVLRVAVPGPPPRDVNTPEEYAALLEELGGSAPDGPE